VLASPEPWLRFFEKGYATELESVAVLAHGDFYARHLLLDESKQLTGVIDWGDAVLCHPAIDLAIAYQMFSLEALNDFFEAYGVVSNNTKLLAKLRAIYSAVSIAWYAHQVQDEFLLQESLYSLKTIQEHLTHEA
jgi:aminoglycoside phosphotransferase (APT) family kinase protein